LVDLESTIYGEESSERKVVKWIGLTEKAFGGETREAK